MNGTQEREEDRSRVGLYIQPATRERLNLYKALLAVRLGKSISQDDAINALLDSAALPVAGAMVAQAVQP